MTCRRSTRSCWQWLRFPVRQEIPTCEISSGITRLSCGLGQGQSDFEIKAQSSNWMEMLSSPKGTSDRCSFSRNDSRRTECGPVSFHPFTVLLVATMVYLNRIYTKTGDTGETSLGDGARVPKTHPRIAAFGGVDELNSVIGLGISEDMPDELAIPLRRIQNDLFDLGADLCVPESQTPPEYPPLRISESQVTNLEQLIDGFNERLQPLTSFILPGGGAAARHLHHARTVCRRVEIGVLQFTQSSQGAHALAVMYLNRLSDLLFVMARIANDEGRADVKWVPGANR